MKRLKLILFIFIAGIAASSHAQFDAQWSQYMFNPGAYNPGAVGLNNDLNVHLSFREQWVGITNAPSTFSLHVSSPLRTGKQISGIGLLMINESIGLFQTQFLQLQYAYKKRLWDGELSLGAQGGLLQQNFDANSIYIPTSDYHNNSDEAIPDGNLEGMIPDFSAGLWYNKDKWYAALSCSHLIGGSIKLNEKESSSEKDAATFRVSRTLYLTGGYNIYFKNPLFTLQPSVLVKSDFKSVQADISGVLNYQKQYWGGLSWRPGDAVVAMAGVNFEFGLSIGYSYDISTTEMIQFSSGSHEIFIGYRKKIDTSIINKKQKSVRLL